MPREWNTPIREPWNPVIKKCLDAVDLHVKLHLDTQEEWHLSQAEILRKYVKDLKVWIHHQEGRE
jgi:hypothetical protein